MIPYAFVWENLKTMDFLETIVVYDIKVGRWSQLNEYMKLFEYQRLRSFIDLGLRHTDLIFSNFFPSITAVPIEILNFIKLTEILLGKMGRAKRIWYLSPMRAAKVQASLRIRAVSPEPPLLAHTSSEKRGTFRRKARSLAPLNGWACAVKICHDGMLEDTNSLDSAQIKFLLLFPVLSHIYGKISCGLTEYGHPSFSHDRSWDNWSIEMIVLVLRHTSSF